jgi:hypothetical protein
MRRDRGMQTSFELLKEDEVVDFSKDFVESLTKIFFNDH